MKIKVSEATGATLDWLVAKCEGVDWLFEDLTKAYSGAAYTTDWKLGGPIIEREEISVFRLEPASRTDTKGTWIPGYDPVYGALIGSYFEVGVDRDSYGDAYSDIYYADQDRVTEGPTPLIAAMRAYVVSKLGEEVEVPDDLI